jgi:hypothetical protein
MEPMGYSNIHFVEFETVLFIGQGGLPMTPETVVSYSLRVCRCPFLVQVNYELLARLSVALGAGNPIPAWMDLRWLSNIWGVSLAVAGETEAGIGGGEAGKPGDPAYTQYDHYGT